MLTRLRDDLVGIVRSAIRACAPDELVSRALSQTSFSTAETVCVVAAGKAASGMVRGFAERFAGRVDGPPLVADGSHPLPDSRSVTAGRAVLARAIAARQRNERVVVLLSGGASAMLAVPADGLALDDKIAATKFLLASGLAISEMNAVRKHLSAIKGGRLAAAAGRSITFAISDVHAPTEDDPAVIGSGPTVSDPSSYADALEALRRASVFDAMPAAVQRHLVAGARGEREETIKPGDPRLAQAQFVLAGSRRDAMAAARTAAAGRGYHVVAFDEPLVGDVAVAAGRFIARVRALGTSVPRPFCVIASGETTVSLPVDGSAGRGGRNQEFTLRVASELPSFGDALFASVGTDGIDGPTDAAGAIADSQTLERAARADLDAAHALRDHDSYPFFAALDDLVLTGPTHTNVGDVQVLLVE